ncbi:MAG: flagellin lysine-N-methylase [Lachnospiraceae bacterium]|nr:flagellin lysine-N-methylase [Lachnospiraceae bacterium]
MRYVKPHYYDDFQCAADKCPDTCCAGWQIVIDEEALERYAHGKGDFAMRLKNSIDWEEESFCQINGRCAMLNDNNLCDLVIAKGDEWLCKTCAGYPRHVEEFDGVRETSLSLSCPVVADNVLRKPNERMSFIVEEDEEDDPLADEFEDFDFLLFSQLEDAREILFAIIQNRQLSIEKRMELLMELAKELQECLDEERLFDMEDVCAKYAGYTDESVATDEVDMKSYINENTFGKARKGFVVFGELERLREDWSEVIACAKEELYSKEYVDYKSVQEEFYDQYVCNTMGKAEWEAFAEQILMIFVYTYFCGAVYDDCIYSKVAMSVFSVFYIQEFIMAFWNRNNKKIDITDCIKLTYRYAREIEHSDENLNMLEEYLMDNMN